MRCDGEHVGWLQLQTEPLRDKAWRRSLTSNAPWIDKYTSGNYDSFQTQGEIELMYCLSRLSTGC